MINPGTLVAAIVAKLRDIPALVTAIGGDATKIASYDYRYPKQTSLREAISELTAPGMLVAFRGIAEGRFPGITSSRTTRVYNFAVFVRSPEILDADPATAGYYAIFEQMEKGVGTASGQRFIYDTIDPGCYPIGGPLGVLPGTDEEGRDFWEVRFSLLEAGDF